MDVWCAWNVSVVRVGEVERIEVIILCNLIAKIFITSVVKLMYSHLSLCMLTVRWSSSVCVARHMSIPYSIVFHVGLSLCGCRVWLFYVYLLCVSVYLGLLVWCVLNIFHLCLILCGCGGMCVRGLHLNYSLGELLCVWLLFIWLSAIWAFLCVCALFVMFGHVKHVSVCCLYGVC